MEHNSPRRKRVSKKTASKSAVRVLVNPFKLVYYREQAGLTIEQLAAKAIVAPLKLKKLEKGSGRKGGAPRSANQFAELELGALTRIESVLHCKGKLSGGQEDDMATNMVLYYETNRHKREQKKATKIYQPGLFKPAAVIFDFDGTLTTALTRTTWERIWVTLGYTVTDCGELAQRYFRKEITHDKWCQLTLEKFKARGLRRDAVREVGAAIEVIDGFEETIECLRRNKVPMYIVSGSIWDVVISAIGKYADYFVRIEANTFDYDGVDVIRNIVGTRYDFEGKGHFVQMVADDLGVSPEQILFVGNSINDEHVKEISGATTMLVNPHYTAPSLKWDMFISEMKNLTEILPRIGFKDVGKLGWSNNIDMPVVPQADALLSMLAPLQEVDLSKFSVVGNYKRHSQTIRTKLNGVYEDVRIALGGPLNTRANYLVAGRPGEGKSFFIQEIARMLQNSLGVKYVEIDISKNDEQTVRTKLEEVKTSKQATFVLVDEIDGRSVSKWPCETVYKYLDLNEDPANVGPKVFALAGSTGGTLEKLRAELAKREKGDDLLKRTLANSKFQVQIPPLDLGDGLCIYVAKIFAAAKKLGKTVEKVDKMALFYGAMKAMQNARQMQMLAEDAVKRLQPGKTVLHYDHNFEPGDRENQMFWTRHRTATEMLVGRAIPIAD